MSSPIEEIINELSSSDSTLLSSKLAELTDLNSERLGFFKQSWRAIEAKRRQQIMSRLIEMAEDNLELNFNGIFKYCLGDEDAEVRNKAIEGLWENEEPSLVNTLLNLMQHDDSEKVQATAATALGKFVILAEYGELRSDQVLNIRGALLAVINDKNRPVEVRRRALEAAAPLNLAEVRAAIMEAYHSPDYVFRVSSIYAMGRNCDPSWLPMLLEELSSSDAELRYEAAGACGELEEEEAVPHLAELIKDTDVDVQRTAIEALGKIGGAEAKKYLEQCLNSPNETLNQAAEHALGELREKEAPLFEL